MGRLLGAFSGLQASVLASRALLVTCMLFSISTDRVTILQITGRWALFWLVTAVDFCSEIGPYEGRGTCHIDFRS